MSERATLEELLEFANKVREAGGGNPIDALMPAVPQDSSQCLIAKNLNFNCSVGASDVRSGGWSMTIRNDAPLAERIAAALGLPVSHRVFYSRIELPPEIGAVARDFDDAEETLWMLSEGEDPEHISRKSKQTLREMWPYIEESRREAYELAGDYVTEDGKIII